MPRLEPIAAVRVVASPSALDGADWPPTVDLIRIAEDEVLVLGGSPPELSDPHAIVLEDTGWWGAAMTVEALESWLEYEAEWPVDLRSDTFQGSVAGVPVKILVGEEQALVITRASLAPDLEERL